MNSKQDYKGISFVSAGNHSQVMSFYASGQAGTETRANGNGNVLERGYYAKLVRKNGKTHGTIGPFSTRKKANENGLIKAMAKRTPKRF